MGNTMQFQGDKSPSTGPKCAIIGWYVLCSAAAVWVTLDNSAAVAPVGDPVRRVALLACAAVYIVRAAHTLFAFVQRRVPWWEAAWGGSIIGCVLFAFLLFGLRAPQPMGVMDAGGVLLYAAGSYLGTASEWSRHGWKARPGHRGHLYTEGLFRFSRHINYFGDLLLFAGFAVLTRQLWAGMVPLGMGLNFVFMIIPAHDAYLASHYGAEFALYANRTRKLVPLVY
jgi:protein-S-isoprenylcysteine O-methyltransferase Ste14